MPAARPAARTLLTRVLPSAIGSFAEIERRLAGRKPAVFLDYDGTMTPIAERPELAVLAAPMRDTVRRLADRCPVAVITGRDRADAERLVGLDSLVYAGSHGFDIAGPDGVAMQHAEAAQLLASLERAEAEVRRRLDGIGGVLVEPKRYALAVHYRLVPDHDVVKVREAVGQTAAAFPELRTTAGKKVLELRPRVEWDKGKAVLWLLDALNLDRADVVPFYLGDDVTDEDAFAALRERGIGVLVGETSDRSLARYRLADVGEVQQFLEALVDQIERSGSADT